MAKHLFLKGHQLIGFAAGGQHHSEKTKERIRLSNLGQKRTEESKRKMSLSHIGKKHTEEWKKNQSIGMKGIKKPPRTKEHCIKLSEAKKKEYQNGKVSPLVKIWKENPDFLRGENNPMWKGGNSRYYKEGYWSKEYLQWRKSVFERDGYTCQVCRKVGGYLTAHHIKSWAKYPELRFNINNGITLCEVCHSLTDNYRGRAKSKLTSQVS